jgi:hypothetical protein
MPLAFKQKVRALQAPQRTRAPVWPPHRRDQRGGQQLRQHARVEPVGLDLAWLVVLPKSRVRLRSGVSRGGREQPVKATTEVVAAKRY